jgi:hypothetical protein
MKASDFINLHQAENVIQAVGFSDLMGWPIRDHLEMNCEEMEIPGRFPDFLTEFFKLAGNWLAYRGVPLLYVYSWEVGRIKGIHVHVLLHIPDRVRRDFKAKSKKWAESLGATIDKTSVHMKEPSRYRDGINRWNAIKGRLRYILKGIDPDIDGVTQAVRRGDELTGEKGPLGIQPAFQGRIYWNRCRASQNLGPSARLRGPKQQKCLIENRLRKAALRPQSPSNKTNLSEFNSPDANPVKASISVPDGSKTTVVVGDKYSPAHNSSLSEEP